MRMLSVGDKVYHWGGWFGTVVSYNPDGEYYVVQANPLLNLAVALPGYEITTENVITVEAVRLPFSLFSEPSATKEWEVKHVTG